MIEITVTTNRAGLTIYKPATKQVDRLEKVEQMDLNRYCAKLWPTEYQSMWHTINESGGSGSAQYGAMLNSMGRKKGVTDWLVMIPRCEYHGLFIELKRCHSGTISNEQRSFMLRQESLGYRCVVAYGFRAALKAIEDYLNLS